MKRLFLTLALLLWGSGAYAACGVTSLTFKDAAGTTQTLCFGGAAGAFLGQTQIVDGSDNIIGSTSNALNVNISSGSIANTAFTANAGTNLNTSLLALESGGNLATLAGGVSGSKYQVNLAAVAAALHLSVNPDQIAGTAIDVNSGVKSAGTQRVVLATDQPQLTNKLLVTPDSVALPANQSVNVSQINGQTAANGGVTGSQLVEQGCAGQTMANTNYTPFSLASTTALKIVTKVSAKKVYICAINIVSAAANNVALIEGTKTTNDCDTSTAGLAGGTTAATGWNFAANGGLTLGNGMGFVVKSATANLDVCLLASGSGQVSGGVTWAQF